MPPDPTNAGYYKNNTGKGALPKVTHESGFLKCSVTLK
jgi:hypothetical protein